MALLDEEGDHDDDDKGENGNNHGKYETNHRINGMDPKMENGHHVKHTSNDSGKNKTPDDEFSSSAVLSTSSYMAALLASALGRHDLARTVLRRRFGSHGRGITRIHPTVWRTAGAIASGNDKEDDLVSLSPHAIHPSRINAAFVPTVYREAIPPHFHKILQHAFRPDSPYWAQSGYDRGVYYSFWIDWPLQSVKPSSRAGAAVLPDTIPSFQVVVSNVIEHMVVEHLLPRVRALLSVEVLSTLAGFEWWVHTRPLGANVGHQLHFDTDEALLEQDGVVAIQSRLRSYI